MKDMRAHLEKLREQIGECEMIRDSAIEPKKRELFASLAEHFTVLAAQIEKAMFDGGAGDTFLGRKTYEPFTQEESD
jgi:hypothetical protein